MGRLIRSAVVSVSYGGLRRWLPIRPLSLALYVMSMTLPWLMEMPRLSLSLNWTRRLLQKPCEVV